MTCIVAVKHGRQAVLAADSCGADGKICRLSPTCALGFTSSFRMGQILNQESGGQCVLVLNGEIFVIDSDFQVAQIDGDYVAIGSGVDAAMGALYALTQVSSKFIGPEPLAAMAHLAVEAAATYLPSVAGRIDTIELAIESKELGTPYRPDY